MSKASDEAQGRYEADPDNWVTVKCADCKEPFQALKRDVPKGEPAYCAECKERHAR